MRQVPKVTSPLFIAALSSVGSGLEYYAFICFALQASTLSVLFFGHSSFALTETLLVFALGSVVTLLGGFLFGVVGDRVGRKKVFLTAVLLMTVATLGIGLLPVTWGFWGLLLLLFLRIVQGVSAGAELPGAITFICEHVHVRQRGFSTSLLFFGVGMGAGLATFVNFLLMHYFTYSDILAYAWRLPFLLALFLGVVAYFLRRRAIETPLFLNQTESTQQFFVALPWRKIFQGLGLVWLPAVMVSLGLFWPSFLMDYLHFNSSTVFLAMTFAFVGTAFLLPLFGFISDKIGRKRFYAVGLVFMLISAYPMLMLLYSAHGAYLFVFSFWYYLMIVILAANYPVMLAELFATRVRYQSVALSYAGCYAIAGVVPAIASSVALKFAILPVLIVFLYASLLISFIAWWFYRDA